MASRSARKKSGRRNSSTAGPRMRSSWCRTACTSISPTASARAAPPNMPNGAICSQRYRSAHPDLADAFEAMQKRDLPSGWEEAIPTFPADPKGVASRDGLGQSRERDRAENPLADRRRRGSCTLHQDADDVRGRRRFPAGGSWRPQPAFRRPRTRDGRGGQRHGAGEASAVRLRLPDLLRLYAQPDPAVGAHGAAVAFHLHARFDRPRRRRADPSAGRAACRSARHSGAGHPAPLRCQRGGGSLARRARRQSIGRPA